ncbi:MAG: M28 family peptidase [Bacteroidetes bacterium]|jgi:hypothetical protein|nr:M28 family peptidase [Bacteroidota bacterium]
MSLRPLRCGLLALIVVLLSAHPAFAQAEQPLDPPPTPTALDQPALVQQYQQTITESDLKAHLYLFASDLFEGRETATRGQKLAAEYLAAQYRKMGVAPKGTAAPDDPDAPAAYFQPFPLYGQRFAGATLTLTTGDATTTHTATLDAPSEDFLLSFGTMDQSSGGIVFAGYGIGDSELGYDDYAALREQGIDLTGKWVLMLRDEPMAADTTSLLTADGAPSTWTERPFRKWRAAFGEGAPAGLLIVGDVGPMGEDVAAAAAERAEAAKQSLGRLSLEAGSSGRPFPPAYTVSTAFADQLLAPSGQTVAALKAQIDDTREPVVLEVPETTLQSEIARETVETSSENVLAFIEGSDPALKDEVVVLSAHYDHIGIDPTAEGDQINNGADDDGSGNVAMLEMAEAFMQAKRDGHGPRRSILLLHVSGEEKGLLGSEYYADVEPVLPLDQTVTNLNIDMIGRVDPTYPDPATKEKYVYVIGSRLISQELHDLTVGVNEATGLDITLNERFNSKDDPNQFYRRSDHWNFGKHGIPFVFFFTGTHEDYHQPGDEAHKVRYDRLQQISRLIFATAWQVANQDAPPAVSGTGFN